MNMLQNARNQVRSAIEAGAVITGIVPAIVDSAKPTAYTVGPYQRATGDRTYAVYWKNVTVYEGPSAYKAAVKFVSAVGRRRAISAVQEATA